MKTIKCPTEGCQSESFLHKASINWKGSVTLDSKSEWEPFMLFASEEGPFLELASPSAVTCEECGAFFALGD